MKIIDVPLEGVKIIEPDRFEDERGWFFEVWNEERYRAAGLPVRFAQDNASYSGRGVLRGMHYQSPNAQGKLISVLSGSIFDAVVDLRVGSPTFGRWFGCELSVDNRLQLWVSEGFAHGFLALSDHTIVHYNCTAPYDAASDRALAWDDPEVLIAWPRQPTVVSDKDRAAPRLREITARAGALPSFR